MRCPFCEIKENVSSKKIIYPYPDKDVRRCDCGAWLDAGQMSMTVNGYRDIYDGAVSLIGDIVDDFKIILEYYDVDFDDEDIAINVYATRIIERLFIPYEGGTSKCNFMSALGITNSVLEFKLNGEEVSE